MASNAADGGLFDCLPSIRRPAAWETPGRSRQLAGHQLSDIDRSHSADESFARRSTAPGWTTSSSLPASAKRRPVIEVHYMYLRHTAPAAWNSHSPAGIVVDCVVKVSVGFFYCYARKPTRLETEILPVIYLQ